MKSTPGEETRIDPKLALRAFQAVREHGNRVSPGESEWRGLRALDIDGYTALLTDGKVTVNILFHSKIALDTPNRRALRRFRERLESVT